MRPRVAFVRLRSPLDATGRGFPLHFRPDRRQHGSESHFWTIAQLKAVEQVEYEFEIDFYSVI